jgi:hypothetical protein
MHGEIVSEEEFGGVIKLLKIKNVVNNNDREDVSQKMFQINVNRYIWIHQSNPTLTDILARFPRYTDCIEIAS